MAGKNKKSVNLKDFPSISSLLEDDRVKPYIDKWPFAFVSAEIKAIASDLKKKAAKGNVQITRAKVVGSVSDELRKIDTDLLKPVINATGVVLHTNLGRAPIDPAVMNYAAESACGYSNLEFDLTGNKRSKRGYVAGKIIAALSGSEAGAVVNNNASSVYLIVANLAAGKEVIISRGQLVQIGGGFRIPEIIERTGAKLKEIGTTNKTSLKDYEKAINKNTGLILIVHKSNFVQKGFTDEPEPSKIVEIAKKKKIPVCYDLGSGLMLKESAHGISDEPDISSAVRSGAELICFSGDKLLGGPQAGLIVGKKKYISELLKDPLYRVVRPDKITLGLVEGTLLKYAGTNPDLRMWNLADISVESLHERAARIRDMIGDSRISTTQLQSSFGGGSLPDYQYPSFGLKIGGDTVSIAEKLRSYSTPVVARTSPGGVLIDLRTVLPEQDRILIEAIRSCL